jgi:hypothetical protein
MICDDRGKDQLIAGCLAAASAAVNLALLALLGVQGGAEHRSLRRGRVGSAGAS